jgi:hypothetical protein
MNRARFFLSFVLVMGVLGCADNRSAEVHGTVRLDGQPVEQGAINFIPVDGKTPTAGAVIEDGEYFSRVPVGLMKVTLSVPKVVGKKKIYATPDSPEMPITVEALPARYNKKSELTLQVERGKNEKNYELSSR